MGIADDADGLVVVVVVVVVVIMEGVDQKPSLPRPGGGDYMRR